MPLALPACTVRGTVLSLPSGMDWIAGIVTTIRRTLRSPRRDALPAGQPASIDDVVARMEEIERTCVDGDGLGAFNDMYLRVTRRVHDSVAGGRFRDTAYMTRLTTIFGGLYLEAVDGAATGQNKAWAPLFECRHDGDRLPVQYAIAGMNAHINHDLPIAVVRTSRQLGTDLGASVAADYRAITAILAAEQDAVRRSFLSGLALEVDRHLTGPVATLVSSWSIARARDAAWTNSQVLWELGALEPLHREFLGTLSRTVGMAGRMLLTPVDELV